MVEGEIKQLENANNASLDEYDYFLALEKKTASLLAACTQIGAITANAKPDILQKCNTLGLMMGYCFQIKDDIFDYANTNNTGKPAGNDIREGKITLPLLHALKQLDTTEQQNILQLLKSKSLDNDNVQYIQQLAVQHGGIQYAQEQMNYFKNKATNILEELPDSDAKYSLQLLAEFIVQRSN
jgi:octaprenyl-diphosphate synthase